MLMLEVARSAARCGVTNRTAGVAHMNGTIPAVPLPQTPAPGAMRDIEALKRMAARHGPSVGAYAAALLDSPLPWTVGGHEILPVDGQEPARWRPRELPSGGRKICPFC